MNLRGWLDLLFGRVEEVDRSPLRSSEFDLGEPRDWGIPWHESFDVSRQYDDNGFLREMHDANGAGLTPSVLVKPVLYGSDEYPKPMPKPVGHREVEICYRVIQRTTASDHALRGVIDRFKKEVALQFGSTVEVQVMALSGTDWKPPSRGQYLFCDDHGRIGCDCP